MQVGFGGRSCAAKDALEWGAPCCLAWSCQPPAACVRSKQGVATHLRASQSPAPIRLPARCPSRLQHLHSGIRWARLAEPASFCLPYHLGKLSAVVTLELVLNPAMEEVVFHSAAFQQLHSLRRLTLQGRLPLGRRRGHRRALPHLAPSVTHLAAHGLNLGATEWVHFGHLRALDLSDSGGWPRAAAARGLPAGPGATPARRRRPS